MKVPIITLPLETRASKSGTSVKSGFVGSSLDTRAGKVVIQIKFCYCSIVINVLLLFCYCSVISSIVII